MGRLTSFLLGVLAITIGTTLYVLPPTSYSFARFFISQIFEDNQSRGQFDGRELALLTHVKSTASHSPKSVLSAIDEYAKSQAWLMNIGDKKGLILDRQVEEHRPLKMLELGTYVGYSAIRIAARLPPAGKLYSVDVMAENVDIAKQVIAHAGLGDRVENLVGTLDNVLEELKTKAPTFDMIFIDHHKSVYLKDLKTLIREGFVRKGTVVVADNVLTPGAPDYLSFVEGPDFATVRHKVFLEYTPFVRDLVTVSVYRG